ncbi:MAG TPA: SUMF1/EgtB/PvdO family nonheme iron enzyme [Planctomycetota bacterium]|nr:SUMF1/EgtB/PvdO family nonheme iron enzyme [Planctomycetota bacterium]
MPKCISCNEVYADQLRRCPHCGYSAEPTPQETRPARSAKPARGSRRIARIAIIAAVTAGAGLAAVLAWPDAESTSPSDLVVRRTPPPDGESETILAPKPAEIEPDPVDTNFQITDAMLLGDQVLVSGTCSANGIVGVRVNGSRATILRDGTRFVARVRAGAGPVEVTADGILGDHVTLRKDVVRVDQPGGEEVRLLSHADGATLHVPVVNVSYAPRHGPAAAVSIEVPMPLVENRFRIERSEFVLYRAPPGLVYLRTTANGHRTFLREIDDQEMVLVPSGVAWRGMGTSEPNGPRHIVEVLPFLIDRTEVTNAQYSRFLHSLGHGPNIHMHHEDPGVTPRPVGWASDDPPPGTEGLPVTGISWYAAWSYAHWAGGRLPTEAEWERAAAGGMGHAYPWGDAFDAMRCRWQAAGPVPADSFLEGASEFDLLHASGNVREWCLDRYDPRWYLRGGRRNPRGPVHSMHRVVRGGSFASPQEALRLQNRDHFDVAKKASDLGFRVARAWDDTERSDD